MMHDHDDKPINLSPAGRAHRQEILRRLQGEAPRAAIRRRRRKRAVVSAASLGGVVIAALLWRPPGAAPPPHLPIAGVPTAPTPRIQVAFVKTDESIVDRLRLEVSSHPDVRIIDDAELVRTLTDLGRPAGVARVGESALLTTDVADTTIGASTSG